MKTKTFKQYLLKEDGYSSYPNEIIFKLSKIDEVKYFDIFYKYDDVLDTDVIDEAVVVLFGDEDVIEEFVEENHLEEYSDDTYILSLDIYSEGLDNFYNDAKRKGIKIKVVEPSEVYLGYDDAEVAKEFLSLVGLRKVAKTI